STKATPGPRVSGRYLCGDNALSCCQRIPLFAGGISSKRSAGCASALPANPAIRSRRRSRYDIHHSLPGRRPLLAIKLRRVPLRLQTQTALRISLPPLDAAFDRANPEHLRVMPLEPVVCTIVGGTAAPDDGRGAMARGQRPGLYCWPRVSMVWDRQVRTRPPGSPVVVNGWRSPE